jgi:hypothetical protein
LTGAFKSNTLSRLTKKAARHGVCTTLTGLAQTTEVTHGSG